MNAPRRKGSLGCFGVFCVFLLLIFTAINVLSLGKLNPFWYDRVAFWKGPLLEPEPTFEVTDNLANRPRDWAQRQATAAETEQPVAVSNATFKLMPETSVRQTLQANQPATLDGGDGLRVEIPAGAIRQNVEAVVTPVIETPDAMAGPLCGPIFSVAIGPQEHYQFATPVRLRLPYNKIEAPDHQVALAFWAGDRWQPVPSTVDPKSGTVVADVNHCSIWTVLGSAGGFVVKKGPYALAAYTLYNWDSVVRGVSWIHKQYGMKCFRTTNFCVYYMTEGEHTVVWDNFYRGRAGRPLRFSSDVAARLEKVTLDPKAVPLFVEDVGRYCEESLSAIQQAGITLESVGKLGTRYNVFIVNQIDPGDTNLGGPVLLSTKLDSSIDDFKINVENGMRQVVMHELLHVAQGNYFSTIRTAMGTQDPKTALDSRAAKPIIEFTAVYLADRICREIGKPAEVMRDYYLGPDKARLCCKSLDRIRDNNYYAYGRFFDWIDLKYQGVGKDIVLEHWVNQPLTIQGLDDAVKAATKKKLSSPLTLGMLFREFTADFLHNEIASAKIAPRVHGVSGREQAALQTSALLDYRASKLAWDEEFTVALSAADPLAEKKSRAMNIYGLTFVPRIDHLTSHAFYVHVASDLRSRKPKVVFDLKPQGGALPGSMYAQHFVSRVGTGVMPAGVKLGVSGQATPTPQGVSMVATFGDSDMDRATFLIHNSNLEKDVLTCEIRRYLLLAPSWCNTTVDTASAASGKKYKITWHPSELERYSDVFAGYNLYRKRVGERDEQYKLLRSKLAGQETTDAPGESGEFDYSVTVVDQQGNESEKAATAPDPFLGKWSGEIQLVKGSLIEDLILQTEKAAGELDAKEQASISKMKPEDQAAARAAWQKQKDAAAGFFGPIKTLVLNAEGVLKLGVPVEFQIRSDKGEYKLMLTDVAYKKTGMTVQHEIALVRMGRDSLRMKLETTTDDEVWSTLKEMGVKSPEFVLTRAPPTASQSSVRNSNQPGQNWVIPQMADGKFRGAELKWWFDRTDDKPPAPVTTATEGFMVEFDRELNAKTKSAGGQ